MVNKKPKRLTTSLNIALSPRDRALIDKAARASGLFPSVWARSVLIVAASSKKDKT